MVLDVQNTKKMIEEGRAVLGIEFGSTRIKAVLINEQNEPVASGSMTGRIGWTTVSGLIHRRISGRVAGSYQTMAYDVEERYGVRISRLKALGFSGMMHGYMALTRMESCWCRFVPGEIRSLRRHQKN